MMTFGELFLTMECVLELTGVVQETPFPVW